MNSSATLHILNKPPAHRRSAECLMQVQAGDAVVLLENAVYSLASGALSALPKDTRCLAIEADMRARGLRTDRVEGAEPIDYNALVTLTVEYSRVINW